VPGPAPVGVSPRPAAHACDTRPVTDWVRWHDAYARPDSPLSRRLAVVVDRLVQVLDALPSGPVRLLSLCAGDGRDVTAATAARPGRRVQALLVEADDALAERARAAGRVPGASTVEVRTGDAGCLGTFADVVPVDVLLLCGVLGNIEHESVHDVVRRVPALVVPGGYVIWTRGGAPPDRRDEVREWFVGEGMAELAFDGAPAPYGVGLNRIGEHRPPRAFAHERLFTFLGPRDAAGRRRRARGCPVPPKE
jgi:hypothetical protein